MAPTTWYTYFNMDHPVVGGYTPDKVALRRAIALGYNLPREIDLLRRGQAMPAQSLLPPGVSGYDPALKSEMSDFDLPRAQGPARPVRLCGPRRRWLARAARRQRRCCWSTPRSRTQLSRQEQGLWQKSLQALGLRVTFRVGQWQENIKASRAGKLMMWGTGWSAAIPDGTYFLDVLNGANKGQSNHARFDLPAFNQLNQRQRVMPDGAERDAVIHQALNLSLAYMPVKATSHPRGDLPVAARMC